MLKPKPQFSKAFRQFEQEVLPSISKNKLEHIIKKLSQLHKIEKSKLKNFLKYRLFIKLYKQTNIDSLVELNLKKLTTNNINGLKLIESDLKKILKKSISLAIRFGFKKSFSEKGIRMANEGDSVQLLFVARAILAGFNCSNVDLRSSKYDAVIDYDSVLLRVQVKGTSLDSNISFMPRPRGGQGIDHKHKRNIGQRITQKDCDLYVAVNKETGLCYIIPMTWADKQTKSSHSIKQISEFEENWNLIESTARLLKGQNK